jgi:hypothetical protein
MAELNIDGDQLVFHMSGLEKAEGFHSDIRVPLASVSDVREVDTAWPDELRGIRAPGTGVPNVIAVGTRRGSFGKDFAAVHGKGPAVVVELEDQEYGRLVLTSDDAAGVVAMVKQATGKS